MKPVVAFIHSKGILIIIYLDDILLAARTYHECLCQTNFAIDLLESLGFRINREKSQLIPSQHIPFLDFVVDSTTMTIGLPLGKIASIQSLAATLKESSQPVTLRSLSRFIGMCTVTRPAVFQAPAHYRHLQFLKKFSFAEFFGAKLGLQQKSVIKSGCKRGFSVVDKPSFTELYSANYPSFPKQNNNNRLFRFRMGDAVRGRSFSRTLVRGRNKVAHKFNPFTSANWFCGLSVMSSNIEIPENRFARFSCGLVC